MNQPTLIINSDMYSVVSNGEIDYISVREQLQNLDLNSIEVDYFCSTQYNPWSRYFIQVDSLVPSGHAYVISNFFSLI